MKHKIAYIFYLLTIFLSYSFVSINQNCSESQRHLSLKIERIEKFKYFDLFTMQGVEPCDNDSCVTVIQRDKSIEIIAADPTTYEPYTMTLTKEDKYWYSRAEFDMQKDKYWLGKSESWPRRYDIFITHDKIIEFEQMLYEDMILRTIFIKNPEEYINIYLVNCNQLCTNPNEIYKKIKSIINGAGSSCIDSETIFEVLRTDTVVKFVNKKNGYVRTGTFPETKVWGGAYGVGYTSD